MDFYDALADAERPRDQTAPVTGFAETATWRRLLVRLESVYGPEAVANGLGARIAKAITDARQARPAPLRALDRDRAADPDWISRSGQSVYTFYVDRFADTLRGVEQRRDYLKALGVRWLHPLPLLKPRPGDSDGGFAVADYRAVDPALGDMSDLSRLAASLREDGIGLLLDIVSNHTAREHEWAQKARAGDPVYRDYYIVLPDAEAVAARERDLIDVFPDTAPGSFTWDAEMGGYVWTTFYPFQWDLNYANPAVFVEMLEILLHLANQGVQGFRLDSAPFLWKREGTHSRNQPEAYALVEAWRAALDLATPGVVLLAEAIESLEDVLPFFGVEGPGCNLAYNNGVMTALWGGLADGDAGIVRRVMAAAAARPARRAWLNYVRCHDDLIWAALSAYAPPEDLARWSAFYGDGAPGSFSDGRAFQSATGLAPSTNGMAAALTGLRRDPSPDGLAAARLRLLYGIVHALDGWPLIYMGDELGLDDDLAYAEDPLRAGDGRWLHRPRMDWDLAAQRATPGTLPASLFSALHGFGAAARTLNDLGVAGPAEPFETAVPAVLAFRRRDGARTLTVFANLSAAPVFLGDVLADGGWRDVLTATDMAGPDLSLDSYGLVWLVDPE